MRKILFYSNNKRSNSFVKPKELHGDNEIIIYHPPKTVNDGPTGPQGDVGPIGPIGPTGAIGLVGIRGFTGPTGQIGQIGSIGSTGPTGQEGPIGFDGDTGSTGSIGPIGPTGPVGQTGTAGPTGSSISNPNTILQGGNSFGTTMQIGTSDVNILELMSANQSVMTLSNSAGVSVPSGKLALNNIILRTEGGSSSYTLSLPMTSGTNGNVLSTDGSGNTSWISPSVTSDTYGNTKGGSNALSSFNSTTFSGNTVFGNYAGSTITTGQDNVCIGSGANVPTGTTNNCIAIGANTVPPASNSIQLGSVGYHSLIGYCSTFSIPGRTYTTGTVSTSNGASTTITGSGTNFTSQMIGGLFVVQVGGLNASLILDVPSSTQLTLLNGISISTGTNYTIYYQGIQADSGGNLAVNNLLVTGSNSAGNYVGITAGPSASYSIILPTAAPTNALNITTGESLIISASGQCSWANAALNGGNSIQGPLSLGTATNSAYPLNLMANGSTQISISPTGYATINGENSTTYSGVISLSTSSTTVIPFEFYYLVPITTAGLYITVNTIFRQNISSPTIVSSTYSALFNLENGQFATGPYNAQTTSSTNNSNTITVSVTPLFASINIGYSISVGGTGTYFYNSIVKYNYV
jgi:hypothetical protein